MLLSAKSLLFCATSSEPGLPFSVNLLCCSRKQREEKGKEQESPGKCQRLHQSMSCPGTPEQSQRCSCVVKEVCLDISSAAVFLCRKLT